MTSQLFTPITLNQLELPNRIVVSPMCQYMAIDGSATDWHLMHCGQLSMGAGGLLILEATHVAPEGRISHRCLGLYSDDNEAALKRVVEFCKGHGVAKLGNHPRMPDAKVPRIRPSKVSVRLGPTRIHGRRWPHRRWLLHLAGLFPRRFPEKG